MQRQIDNIEPIEVRETLVHGQLVQVKVYPKGVGTLQADHETRNNADLGPGAKPDFSWGFGFRKPAVSTIEE